MSLQRNVKILNAVMEQLTLQQLSLDITQIGSMN